MSDPDLGTLQMVDVRKVWNHEERDFTPWLADNLLRLNAALDMNLEVVAIEDRKQEAGSRTGRYLGEGHRKRS